MKIAIGCDPNAQTAKEEIIKFIVKKCLGAFTIGSKLREELVEAFLTNEFEPGCASQPKVDAFRKYDLER